MGNHNVILCPPAQQAAALRLLHAGLPSDQQAALVHALDSVRDQSDTALAGLLIAIDPSHSGEIVGAVWVQLAAGRTAVVWPPASVDSAGIDLMKAVASFLDERQIALAQFLVSDEATLSPSLLAAADFQKLAKLAYLMVDSRHFPAQQPSGQLAFEPGASGDPDRLGELLMRTYEGSQDCPQLNGLRNSDEVIVGYREQGEFVPERWFFVKQAAADVGVLLLTEHPDSGNWELVYMGLVPDVRGGGLGQQVLAFAMWQAWLGGAKRVVLAVDEANQPALDMYQQAGFVAWDYRTVYARLRPPRDEQRV